MRTAASSEVNTLATLAVIFAFVFAPAGAVLGHLGLTQISRTGQPGRNRALVGLILSYVVIVVAVAALVVWSVTGADPAPAAPVAQAPISVAPPITTATTTTPPPPPVVDTAALPGLLLTVEEAGALTGDTGLTNTETLTAPQLPPANESTYEPLDCLPSFMASTTPAYSRSGQLGFHGTVLGNYDSLLQIAQAVSRYTDAATAQRMLGAHREQWARCAGTTLLWHMMQDQASAPITLGSPQDAGDGVISLVSESTLDKVPYQRAIAAKNNVFIDVQVSGGDENPGQAAEVVKRILAKIPG